MKFSDKIKRMLQDNQQENKAASVHNGKKKEMGTFGYICQWIYKLRTVILAIPVVLGAVILALYNAANLPEKLQIYFPASANKEVMVKMVEMGKGAAIFVPLLVTAFCLLMMFCSKKVLYPWLISVFSLVLPLFFIFISVFPG